MNQHLCRVIENRRLWNGTQFIAFNAPELAAHTCPGQFALARDPTTLDPYLRRTLWFYRAERERIEFTIGAEDPLVSRARIGATLDLLAPFGNPVKFQEIARRILLIGEAKHIARLICFALDAIAVNREVVLVSNDETFPAHLLPPEVEYRVDGLDADLIAWADGIVLAGSNAFVHSVAEKIRAARYRLLRGFARVLMDVAMPCGTGSCYACAIGTESGIHLACQDAAIDLADVERSR